MKGYTPRERLGLIMLALVVASLFLIERILDSSSCRRQEEIQGIQSMDSNEVAPLDTSDAIWIRKSDRSEAHKKSDSIRDARKSLYKDSLRFHSKRGNKKGKSKSSGKNGRRQSAPAPKRSLRDEKL